MKKLWLYGLCVLLLCGCNHREKFPDEPYIEFVRLEADSADGNKATLVLYFQDGNGDIGLSESDTIGPFSPDSLYYYNFFIDYYEKQQGEWVKIELPMPLHCRVPRLSNEESESISGQISVPTWIRSPLSQFDTTRLVCRLVDRALNVSNAVETPEIIRK